MKASKALKPGWRRVKFGDVVRQVKDKVDPDTSGLERYVAGEHMDTDDLRIRRWGQIGDGYLGPAFHMRFKPGQVLYGSRRTYLRKVAVADFTGICANTTFVIETKDTSILLQEYLPLVMQTEAFHAHSIKQSKGSVNPYVNFSDLVWFEFVLPPVEEQLRVIKLLEEIESSSSKYEDVEKHANWLAIALLRDTLESKWPLIELGSAVQSTQYGLSLNSDDKGAYPILRMMNLENGRCVENDIKYVNLSDKDFDAYRLVHGDVLFNRTNSYELVGRTGMYDLDGDHVFASYLVRIKVDVEKLAPDYLTLFLNSDQGRQQVLSFATKGVSQANVNASNLLRIRIPLPPLSVQEELLGQIASVKLAEDSVRTRRASITKMKRLILAGIAEE